MQDINKYQNLMDEFENTPEYKRLWGIIQDKGIETKIPYSHPIKTNGQTIRMSVGRVFFNSMMPDKYKLIDEKMDKNKIKSILREISEQFSPFEASKTASLIQQQGFKVSTLYPSTFSSDGLILPDRLKQEIKDFQKQIENLSDREYLKKKEELARKVYQHLKDVNMTLYNDLDGKLTGKMNIDTLGLLFVSKGFTVDLEGNIKKIANSLSDGYNIEDYYTAGAEGRRGFYIRSTAVSEPGYLSRKLTYANANVKILDEDCKSKKYLELFVDNSNIGRLVGRYYINPSTGKLKILEPGDKDLIGKKIKFRSPLYCKTKMGLCHTCYGNLSKQLENTNVGILAGGAFNNEVLNLMMKTRHKTSHIEIIEVNFPEMLKNAPINSLPLLKVLDFQEKKIVAKKQIRINIDKRDYDDNIDDFGDKLKMPGLLDVIVGEGEDSYILNLPFTFEVEVVKPEMYIEEGRYINMTFEPGDVILEATQYIKETNPRIIGRLLDGVTKYVTSPELFLQILISQMSSTDYVHLETVIQNMFRSKHDNSVFGRLVDYKDVEILGSKKIPHVDGSSLAFEDIKKAIKTILLNNRKIPINPIESILLEKGYGSEN